MLRNNEMKLVLDKFITVDGLDIHCLCHIPQKLKWDIINSTKLPTFQLSGTEQLFQAECKPCALVPTSRHGSRNRRKVSTSITQQSTAVPGCYTDERRRGSERESGMRFVTEWKRLRIVKVPLLDNSGNKHLFSQKSSDRCNNN